MLDGELLHAREERRIALLERGQTIRRVGIQSFHSARGLARTPAPARRAQCERRSGRARTSPRALLDFRPLKPPAGAARIVGAALPTANAMTIAALALDALIEPAAADAQRRRARLDGRAWGLAAVGCTQGSELLEERAPPPSRLHGAQALIEAHHSVWAAGALPEPELGAEEAPLALRAAALAAWCAGALDGLHSAALEALTRLDGAALEAYQDLAALATAAADERPDEAGEIALADLVEHARVALALVGVSLGTPAPEADARR
jgi:uncharacterized protein YgfB (UPF0149 family)